MKITFATSEELRREAYNKSLYQLRLLLYVIHDVPPLRRLDGYLTMWRQGFLSDLVACHMVLTSLHPLSAWERERSGGGRREEWQVFIGWLRQQQIPEELVTVLAAPLQAEDFENAFDALGQRLYDEGELWSGRGIVFDTYFGARTGHELN